MPVSKVSNRGVSVILSRPPNLYSGRSATVEADRTAQHPSLYQLSSNADQATVEHVMPTDGTNIPPCVKPESMTQEDFDKEISSLKKMCDEILNTYILEGSTREVNLPTLIRNPLISLLKDGTFHPDVFNIAYEHIANMLRVNRLSNFLQEGFDIARSASLIENSLPKFGLDQILRDETLPPYTKLDYYEYLKEHQMQQDLKFIIDLEEYTNSAEQFYPSKIFNPRGSAISHAKTKRMSANMSIVPDTAINRLNRDSSTKRRSTTSSNQYEFTSEQLATLTYIPGPERPSGMTVDVYQQNIDSLKEKALKLYDSYISMESTFSINIPPIIRKPLIEIIQDSHFHPQVFLAAKLAVLDHLTANTLPKFLKKSHQMILSSGLSFQLFSSNRRKIDQLLLEELPHPYSYSNFLEFAEPYVN
ncbi:hypothetical protein BC833DRAFT_100739 [Globomyces pollinis-pini]|nr:hypothetical protein BC833DRAFT_100739 [Globomyces pollinis-pini]